MEKIIMKSFLYTIAVLVGVITVAQANTEAKQDAEEAEIVIEEVNAEASPEAKTDIKKEETK